MYESEHDLCGRMNDVSGWKRTWKRRKIRAVLGIELWLCDDWTQCSIHGDNQASCKADHCEFGLYPDGGSDMKWNTELWNDWLTVLSFPSADA